MEGSVFLFSFEEKKFFHFLLFFASTVWPAVFFFSRFSFSLWIISHILFKNASATHLQDDVAGGVANLRVLTAPPLQIHLRRVSILNTCLFFFYKTIKLAHIWMGKTFLHKCCIPFCTKSIHNFKYLRKLISCSPRRWLVSERTVCSCTLRPRSWLLPGCCQYEYICDFLLYWYIFVMILYQYIDKWLPYLWYRVTVKNSNHNVFFKFVLFKRIIILE